jgi:hypothetical protein
MRSFQIRTTDDIVIVFLLVLAFTGPDSVTASSSLRAFARNDDIGESSEAQLHGRKLPLIDFSDPKEVHIKESESEVSTYKLNILALGGSVTWGAHLQHRNESYPYVIQNLYEEVLGNDVEVTVDNMAIRATGADYPSLCLQSMVEEANPDEPEKSYDLVSALSNPFSSLL